LKPPQLNKAQFRIYFLIYAAHVDYEYTSHEHSYLEANCDSTELNKMMELFNSHSDYASLKLILAHKQLYLQSAEDRQSIYQEVIKIFKADGDYSRSEKTFLEFFEKLVVEINLH